MPSNTPVGRYVTLRDYLRVVRRYRIAIVLIAAIGAGAGVYDAKRLTPVYQGAATVSFQDPAQDASLVGLGTSLVQTPAQLATTNSETLTRPEVMLKVQHKLKTSRSYASLAGAVSGQVTAAGLLQVSATDTNPSFASALANAVANVLVAQSNASTRAGFKGAADDVKHQLNALKAHTSKTGGKAGNANAANANASNGNSTQLAIFSDELARLETLARFAQSAQVAQNAQTPTAPVSPSTVRNGIIGLLLGLLLGLLVAFVRDSMDRRLRTPYDIEESFHHPIVGHVRDQAMGKVVHPEMDGRGDNALDVEGFRILRRNLEFLNFDSPPRTIVVTSAVPEEGKTTVASSLAFAIASTGKRTLLVDCDLRRPALASRVGVEKSPGISDYLAGEATPEQILRPVVFSEPPNLNGDGAHANGGGSAAETHTLVCIPAGSPTSHAAELLGSRRFKEFLDEVTLAYDMIVIDSSPLLPVADTLEIVPLVEAVLVCAREVKTTREEARAARNALSRFPARPTGVVITGVKARRSEYEVYSYTYGDA
jgi:Mrp family chromosome partitioning ATPase